MSKPIDCIILFRSHPDGRLEIEAQHEGEFNHDIKSHAALDAVVKALPLIFEAAPVPESAIIQPAPITKKAIHDQTKAQSH